MTAWIHIDGSSGEGGGQILRTALALAALLRKPVKIDNIRANRPQPGLKTQHLAGVHALAEITRAEIGGAASHSTSITFAPRILRGGNYRFEISTAGAAGLLLGTVLPPLLFAAEPSEITITGGTHVPFSPPVDYLAKVFIPVLRKMGADVSLELVRYGFYPRGGGSIRVHVSPVHKLCGIKLEERGPLTGLQLIAGSANLPDHIARREIKFIEETLRKYRGSIRSYPFACQAESPGNSVCLVAEYARATAGFDALGKPGRPAEDVAAEVCREFSLFEKTGATVDSRLADQIILYMALASGESSFITPEITSHLATNIDIIRRFLPARIEMDRSSGHVLIAGEDFAPVK